MLDFSRFNINKNTENSAKICLAVLGFEDEFKDKLLALLSDYDDVNVSLFNNIEELVFEKNITHVILDSSITKAVEDVMLTVDEIGTSKNYLVIGDVNDINFMKALELNGLKYIYSNVDSRSLKSEIDFYINNDIQAKYASKQAKRIYLVGACGGVGVSTLSFQMARSLSTLNYKTLLVNHQYGVENFVTIAKDPMLSSRLISNDELTLETLDEATANSLLIDYEQNLSLLSIHSKDMNLYGYQFTRKILPVIDILGASFDFSIHDVSASVDFNYRELEPESTNDVVVVVFSPTLEGVKNANAIYEYFNGKVEKVISVVTQPPCKNSLSDRELKKYVNNRNLNIFRKKGRFDKLVKRDGGLKLLVNEITNRNKYGL